MEIQISQKDNVKTITPVLETIDLGNSVELRQKLSEMIDDSTREILLDLSKVKTIDSSGIGLIIRFWQVAQDHGITTKLGHLNPKVLEAIHVAHLEKQITII